jgi:hypothetical protein
MLGFSAPFQPRKFRFQLGALRRSSSLVGTESLCQHSACNYPSGTYIPAPVEERIGRAADQPGVMRVARIQMLSAATCRGSPLYGHPQFRKQPSYVARQTLRQFGLSWRIIADCLGSLPRRTTNLRTSFLPQGPTGFRPNESGGSSNRTFRSRP